MRDVAIEKPEVAVFVDEAARTAQLVFDDVEPTFSNGVDESPMVAVRTVGLFLQEVVVVPLAKFLEPAQEDHRGDARSGVVRRGVE